MSDNTLFSQVYKVMNNWIVAINAGDGAAACRCHKFFCRFKHWDEFHERYQVSGYGKYLMEKFADMDDLEYHVSLGDDYPAHKEEILSRKEFEKTNGGGTAESVGEQGVGGRLNSRMVPVVLDEQKKTPMERFINVHYNELILQYELLATHADDGVMVCDDASGLLAKMWRRIVYKMTKGRSISLYIGEHDCGMREARAKLLELVKVRFQKEDVAVLDLGEIHLITCVEAGPLNECVVEVSGERGSRRCCTEIALSCNRFEMTDGHRLWNIRTEYLLAQWQQEMRRCIQNGVALPEFFEGENIELPSAEEAVLWARTGRVGQLKGVGMTAEQMYEVFDGLPKGLGRNCVTFCVADSGMGAASYQVGKLNIGSGDFFSIDSDDGGDTTHTVDEIKYLLSLCPKGRVLFFNDRYWEGEIDCYEVTDCQCAERKNGKGNCIPINFILRVRPFRLSSHDSAGVMTWFDFPASPESCADVVLSNGQMKYVKPHEE